MDDALTRPAARSPRQRRTVGRVQREANHERHALSQKPAEPAMCPRCGAIYGAGRWRWGQPPAGAPHSLCPACRRIAEDVPAGILTLHGAFPAARRDEIVALARHQEDAEKREHALNRIMRIEENPQALVITTTDIHLPRRIGEAVRRAYRGKLKLWFDENGDFARVDWHPPAD